MSETYLDSIRLFRQKKVDELHGDTGWLALAGLYWLNEGLNTLGTDPACDVLLPDGSAEPHVGTIDFRSGQATLSVTAGTPALVDGQPATTAVLRPDSTGAPTVVWLGRLRFVVIERRGRFAVRLWDHRKDTRAGFPGRQWYPIDAAYCVPATLAPYDLPRNVEIADVTGDVGAMPSLGELVFALHGQEHRLVALGKLGSLRVYFRDRTSGDTTYPACRYLDADTAPDGSITLDFNKAYSPPCAYTAFATCPLPPRQNHLPIRIEAGELFDNSRH
ncbi:MAG: DUF1684 domain-containing protein [Chloroflexi bacterium]|nr:DUF1684 domain-containing protein [Chloroflexota bacterium]